MNRFKTLALPIVLLVLCVLAFAGTQTTSFAAQNSTEPEKQAAEKQAAEKQAAWDAFWELQKKAYDLAEKKDTGSASAFRQAAQSLAIYRVKYAIRKSASDAEAAYRLGLLYRLAGDKAQSDDAFDEAAHNPNVGKANWNSEPLKDRPEIKMRLRQSSGGGTTAGSKGGGHKIRGNTRAHTGD